MALVCMTMAFTSCENYSNGDRVGYITQFSKTGSVWKSYEGHLNTTQTGMNSSQGWDFSLDNDNDSPEQDRMIFQLDSALELGWRVRLKYHETAGKNWFSNRGHTDFFITHVEVLDRGHVTYEAPKMAVDTPKFLEGGKIPPMN